MRTGGIVGIEACISRAHRVNSGVIERPRNLFCDNFTEFRDGKTGLLWLESQSERGVIGRVSRKELFVRRIPLEYTEGLVSVSHVQNRAFAYLKIQGEFPR